MGRRAGVLLLRVVGPAWQAHVHFRGDTFSRLPSPRLLSRTDAHRRLATAPFMTRMPLGALAPAWGLP